MDKVGCLCLWGHRRGLPTFICSNSIMDKAEMRAPRGLLPQKDTHSKIRAKKEVVLLPFCQGLTCVHRAIPIKEISYIIVCIPLFQTLKATSNLFPLFLTIFSGAHVNTREDFKPDIPALGLRLRRKYPIVNILFLICIILKGESL